MRVKDQFDISVIPTFKHDQPFGDRDIEVLTSVTDLITDFACEDAKYVTKSMTVRNEVTELRENDIYVPVNKFQSQWTIVKRMSSPVFAAPKSLIIRPKGDYPSEAILGLKRLREHLWVKDGLLKVYNKALIGDTALETLVADEVGSMVGILETMTQLAVKRRKLDKLYRDMEECLLTRFASGNP